ncbi:MAG: helix-turn-helix domain-containing protein [Calothrix sp. C42_A2020_038]|nr:helix-turn-helix domain-containing protein [Calothrix sp. C42_A2020_038]
MKQEVLRNNLKQIRTRLGMNQQDLANLAGVTRQTISGVESGQYAPSTTISLRLAKALGCQVEDLFWLEEDLPEIEAVPVQNLPVGQDLRVILARVGGQWVAHPLIGKDAFRTEMIPADGASNRLPFMDTILVKLLDDPKKLYNTVVLAGCSPALSLWARAAERWHPELRVHLTFANSMTALQRLCRGEIHIAGMHLYCSETGEHNTPFVHRSLENKAAVLINLGVWEEGLLVQQGNPKNLKTVADLAQSGVTIVNREYGSGSREVLERKLREEKITCEDIQGFDKIVNGHQEVALAVATGKADAGVSSASIATAFGLGFIPLYKSRYDLVVLKQSLEEPPVQQLLGTLGHRQVISQLQALGGYDTNLTGEVVAKVEAVGNVKHN